MKELTRPMLEQQYNIRVYQDNTKPCGYKILHLGRNNRGKEFTWKELTPVVNGKYHPKSNTTKYYYVVGWSDYAANKTQITLPLARLVYAWFFGRVPVKMDVDHIDNNSLNNSLDNLQLLTRSENLKKREGWLNQYGPKKVN